MDNKSDLPPLLGSDDKTLQNDYFDHFYRKRPSEVWTGKIERTEVKDPVKCEHYFIPDEGGVRCKKCHAGLTGNGLTAKDGQLYYSGKKIL